LHNPDAIQCQNWKQIVPFDPAEQKRQAANENYQQKDEDDAQEAKDHFFHGGEFAQCQKLAQDHADSGSKGKFKTKKAKKAKRFLTKHDAILYHSVRYVPPKGLEAAAGSMVGGSDVMKSLPHTRSVRALF
jgi:hypothetical protein